MKLEARLKELGYSGEIFTTLNGRSSLYIFLKSLNLHKGTKVAISPFTCVAAIYPLICLGLTPVYIDIDDDFQISLKDLKKKWNDDIAVCIIQSTFGIRSNAELISWVKSRGSVVIADDAHSLGAEFSVSHKDVDAIYLSFGVEKSLSSKIGGALVVNSLDLARKVRDQYDKIHNPSWSTVLYHLVQPLIFPLARRFSFLWSFFKKYSLLYSGVNSFELEGLVIDEKLWVRKLGYVLESYLLFMFKNFEMVTKKREKVVVEYNHIFGKNYNGALIKYPVLKSELSHSQLKAIYSSGLYISNWYDSLIYPSGVNLVIYGYEVGSCPNAEKLSKEIINLPTGNGVDLKTIHRLSDMFHTS